MLKRGTEKELEQALLDNDTQVHSFDIFSGDSPNNRLYGQHSYKCFENKTLDWHSHEIQGIKILRLSQSYSATHSNYDYGGIEEGNSFKVPQDILIQNLKLSPASAWSPVFNTENETPLFCDYRTKGGGAVIIRGDLLSQFIEKYDLVPVWRVWFEKDGGDGRGYYDDNDKKGTFVRNDFLGLYWQTSTGWHKNIIKRSNK